MQLHAAQQSCTSLDVIQRSMPDYVIHSTAGIIGEVDSMLSRMHNTGCAGASEARVLDNMSTHRTRAISQKWSRCFAMTARRNATNSPISPCARLAVTRARPAPRNVRRLPLNAELRPPVWQGRFDRFAPVRIAVKAATLKTHDKLALSASLCARGVMPSAGLSYR